MRTSSATREVQASKLWPLPSPLATKSSAARVCLSSCNSSLNKLQSKLTDRRPCACRHTQLWEKVPGHPHHVRIRRKAPPQKHFAAHRSRNLHPSLALAHRSHSYSEAVRLGSAGRGTSPSGLPRERRRGYESALLTLWVLRSSSGKVR